jgi:intracellular sulfur oxidation DsrE/DsrF family protein
MNGSLSVFAGITIVALALGSSAHAQFGSSAQFGAPAQVSTPPRISTPGKIRTHKVRTPPKISDAPSQKQPHRLAVQVDVNDPAIMNLALNNVSNAAQHYQELGQKVEIEVVAFGPGLHMLRDDTSPVKARIKSMSETVPKLTFSACGNTRENMTRAEAKEVPLISEAKVVKSGVVRLIELQERDWSYLRP